MNNLTHNDYVRQLVKKIRQHYVIVEQNVDMKKYRRRHDNYRLLGEIDVLAIGTDILDIYEVKSTKTSSNMEKAVIQLERARSLLGFKGNDYFYSPAYGIQPLEDIIKEINGRKK